MIVTRAPVPGLGLITNWDFDAPAVTPLAGVQLMGDQPAELPALDGISDVFDALAASSWAFRNRKWLVGGGVALAAFGAYKLLF